MSSEEEESGEDGGGWLVSYADLMTLLFAAFVVLYGITPQGKSDSMMGVVSTIRESFVMIPDQVSGEERKVGPQKKGKFMFKAYTGETEKTDTVMRTKVTESQKIAIDKDRAKITQFLDQLATEQGKTDFNLRNRMMVYEDSGALVLDLAAAIFFESGSYKLSLDGQRLIRDIGKVLVNLDKDIVVEGHTDPVPMGGLSNDALGALRAYDVAKVFTQKSGFSPARVRTVSYGSSRPASTEQTSASNARNRRIEIKVMY